ncbi:hypothetical protein PVAG01_07316 [Phlyctema vagabunda]|uniref:Uncharacterized protein n=1 Tax=Phlyctema vagabunda TaxID=108571 RepID=A0ABR4PC20_9HELO
MRVSVFLGSVVALLATSITAAPLEDKRQVIYGCDFKGKGIEAYISVGHDETYDGDDGESYLLDCGTTSSQRVPGIFAKCAVNGKEITQPSRADDTTILCKF